MNPSLETMLSHLGIKPKPRFTVEEVGEILGIRRDQVIDLLKRKKLIGMKSSVNRWSGVFTQDLDTYLREVNDPKVASRRASLPEIPLIATVPVVSVQPEAHGVASSNPPENLVSAISRMQTAPAGHRRELGL